MNDANKLIRADDDSCAFCPEDALDDVFVYTLEDYAGTNLGETPPMRHIPLCAHHYDILQLESTLVTQESVPGVGEDVETSPNA